MARLDWAKIEEGCKPARRWLVLVTLCGMYAIVFAWLLFLAGWFKAAKDSNLTKLEFLWITSAVFWALPVACVLLFWLHNLWMHSKAVKCPECGGAILPMQALLLKITGRCGHCGARLEVDGQPAQPEVDAQVLNAPLIPRKRLEAQTLSRPAQVVGIFSLTAFPLTVGLGMMGLELPGWVFGTGTAVSFAGILVSCVILHFHQKRIGKPPDCPHCGLLFSPVPSYFVLMTGHCGRCGRQVAAISTEKEAPPISTMLGRKSFVQSGKTIKAANWLFVAAWFTAFWSGCVVAFWAWAYFGKDLALGVTRLMAITLVVMPLLFWLVDRRFRADPRLRCPTCAKSLASSFKIWDAIVATGCCWHCSAKILPDD